MQLDTDANKQGRVAGTNASGGDVACTGLIGTAASRICRYEVARTGLSDDPLLIAARQTATLAVCVRFTEIVLTIGL